MTPIQRVLEHYGIQVPPRLGEVKLRCPLGTHDDRRPSATVNLTTGLFYCHSSGAGGDAHTLIMERENVGHREAFRIEEEILGGSREGFSRESPGRRGLSGGKRNQLSGGSPLSSGRGWR